jgi:hypothetical protein
MSGSDDDELVGDPEQEQDPMGSPLQGGDEDDEEGAEEAEEEAVEMGGVLYYNYNRQYYKLSKATDTSAGWVRNYNRVVQVKDGKVLGLLARGVPEEWALLEKVTADKIVVCKARVKEDDPELVFTWYLLIEAQGVHGKSDHLIIRHIPKSSCKAIVQAIVKDDTMKDSSLLKMLPHAENAKGLNPTINKLSKCGKGEEPKSALVEPPKPPGKRAAEVDAEGEAKPVKQSKHAKPEEKTEEKKKEEKKEEKAAPARKPSAGKEAAKAKEPAKEPAKPSGNSFFVPQAPAAPAAARKPEAPAERSAGESAAGGEPKKKKAMVEKLEGPVQATATYSFEICSDDTTQIVLSIPAGLKPTGGTASVTYTFA